MKAAFLIKKRRVVIEDIPCPEIKDETEVLVRIRSVGICGSDIHYYLEGKIGDQIVRNPIILGHEAAGDIIKIGKGVKHLKEGQKVAIEPGISCGMCFHCLTGKPNLCPDVKFFGTPPVDGALREYVVMPERNLIPLPSEVDYDEGVLSEPLAIGLYGVRLSGFSVGDSVSIIGAGPIGLSVLFSVVIGGARKVFISDLLKPRIEMAEKLGAERVVLASKEDIVEVVKKETKGVGVDICYEAAGKRETFFQSTEVVRIGGKVAIYGIPADDRIEFNAHSIRRKELNVTNIRRSAHTTELAIELMKKRKDIPFSSIVTHRFPLEKIEEALNLVAEYKDGVIKAVIEI
ncbi:MAG: alcohol dehydrogenase catalytic domain-containing protein [Candidatus Omnitrophica bacterium]|nr:alcohol dehydrogenase catalytic domain-containing protein [Candidatus Omnitrophota bacterium]MCM8777937.1 alcohol dehydrogenase catalytic domain-containing protein [Candidatus Omnitrophota bacterium]